MYGTVATFRVKSGQETKLNGLMEQWWRERAPKAKGAMSSTLYKSDNNPGQYMLAVMFDNKANYEANAEDPEQDKWYKEMVACLDGEPAWNDGEVVSHQHQH